MRSLARAAWFAHPLHVCCMSSASSSVWFFARPLHCPLYASLPGLCIVQALGTHIIHHAANHFLQSMAFLGAVPSFHSRTQSRSWDTSSTLNYGLMR